MAMESVYLHYDLSFRKVSLSRWHNSMRHEQEGLLYPATNQMRRIDTLQLLAHVAQCVS